MSDEPVEVAPEEGQEEGHPPLDPEVQARREAALRLVRGR